MKQFSIKLKITLWYSLVMIITSVIVLSIMTSVSREMLTRDMTDRVTRTVFSFSQRLQRPDGDIRKIPEFGFYEQGVHMEVYDHNYNVIGGHIPFDFDDTTGFEDDTLKTFTDNEDTYYIYTKKIPRFNLSPYWIKGVVSVSQETYAIQSAAKTNIILTAILLLIAIIGGYFIVRQALSPVSKISRIASEISKSKDLSQRIHIGSGTDEIHTLANTFDHMLEKIEQMVEREKQFTSDASHELRTPVAVILSECEYMIDCAKSDHEFKESAVSVKMQAEKMSRLISELLMISRMDKDTLQTEFEEIDLSELLGFVCDEQAEIQPNHITLYRNIEPGITAKADRFLLTRLCINLISNAYHYGKTGGMVTVSLTDAGEHIVLQVADDGIGIAKEHQSKIWERFYQVDPSRTANEDGSMGLGLSMVKWIAECHNGSIQVESTLGSGSTFTLTLPKIL